MILQLAAEGLADFSKFRFFDKGCNRHLKLMMQGLRRSNRRATRQLLYDQMLSLLSSQRIPANKIDEVTQRIDQLHDEIVETYYPTERGRRIQHEKDLVRSEISAWESKYGSMDDPETKAKIAKFVQAMDKAREDTAKKQQTMSKGLLGRLGDQYSPARKGRRGT